MSWKNTNERFVAFFDILGFKDMVLENDHKFILDKLTELKDLADSLERFSANEEEEKDEVLFKQNQTKSVTFSDSLIVFSCGDSVQDLVKILFDSFVIINRAIEIGLPIKGAISYGEMTVDFKKSLFFGQPLIDAYLLHDDLVMMATVLHHKAESKAKELENDAIKKITHFRKSKMKFGTVNQTIVASSDKDLNEGIIESLKKQYSYASGKPRIYIDNSIDFYSEIIQD